MTETISEHLRRVREEHSLSLAQAAQATRIRLHYLEAIESGDFSALPSVAQARGFVRTYAGYLGIDPRSLESSIAREIPLSSGPIAPEGGVRSEAVVVESEEAEAIFAEIGEKLRTQRESLGLSLEDVERHTHIRLHYLKALEAGDMKGLPSPVQGRGMLNNYAGFLGGDPEPLLLRFAEGLQANLASRQAKSSRPRRPSQRQNRPEASALRRITSIDFLLGGVVIAFLLGFTVWGGVRINNLLGDENDRTPTPTAPSISDILMSDPSDEGPPTPSGTALTPEAGVIGTVQADETGSTLGNDNSTEVVAGAVLPASQETPQITLPAPNNAAIQIHVIVRQRTWMRILVDDEIEFEGRVTPGSAYSFYGEQSVEILAGSGSALQVYYNQLDMGTLGLFGEVVQLVFTRDGILAPTATITPTPSPTETPTPEGTPGATPANTPAAGGEANTQAAPVPGP